MPWRHSSRLNGAAAEERQVIGAEATIVSASLDWSYGLDLRAW